jgi:hypothetical protein
MADDGKRGYNPGMRPRTALIMAWALADAVASGLWLRFNP